MSVSDPHSTASKSTYATEKSVRVNHSASIETWFDEQISPLRTNLCAIANAQRDQSAPVEMTTTPGPLEY